MSRANLLHIGIRSASFYHHYTSAKIRTPCHSLGMLECVHDSQRIVDICMNVKRHRECAGKKVLLMFLDKYQRCCDMLASVKILVNMRKMRLRKPWLKWSGPDCPISHMSLVVVVRTTCATYLTLAFASYKRRPRVATRTVQSRTESNSRASPSPGDVATAVAAVVALYFAVPAGPSFVRLCEFGFCRGPVLCKLRRPSFNKLCDLCLSHSNQSPLHSRHQGAISHPVTVLSSHKVQHTRTSENQGTCPSGTPCDEIWVRDAKLWVRPCLCASVPCIMCEMGSNLEWHQGEHTVIKFAMRKPLSDMMKTGSCAAMALELHHALMPIRNHISPSSTPTLCPEPEFETRGTVRVSKCSDPTTEDMAHETKHNKMN